MLIFGLNMNSTLTPMPITMVPEPCIKRLYQPGLEIVALKNIVFLRFVFFIKCIFYYLCYHEA